MTFITIPIEQTTAITDFLLGILYAVSAVGIYRFGIRKDKIKTYIWSVLFGLLAIASLLGAVAHGLEMSREVNALLWQPLNLALGFAVGLFVVGVIYDLRQYSLPRGLLPAMLLVVFIFYLLAFILNKFIVFIIYQSLALLFAFIVYSYLAYRNRLRGAWLMATGIIISIAASAIQALINFDIKIIWEFNQNGIFHIIQMFGIIFFYWGLRMDLLNPS